jgi:hypothetical protein
LDIVDSYIGFHPGENFRFSVSLYCGAGNLTDRLLTVSSNVGGARALPAG